jgi:hypothetical protein
MKNKRIEPMDETDLQRNVALLGRPPVLSTEDVEAFKKLFVEIAKCFKVSDILMLELAWQYAVNIWFIRRLMTHSTIAIERWYVRNRDTEIVQAQIKNAQYERQLQSKAQQMSRNPADVAEMAALEKKISNTVVDIDRIFAHKATEMDHNRAIQVSAELQMNLEQLINGATRRRNEAFYLLEQYSAGLGRTVEEAFDKIVDAEFEELQNETKIRTESKLEDQSVITAAPSIAPTGDEKSNDLDLQDRSEPPK